VKLKSELKHHERRRTTSPAAGVDGAAVAACWALHLRRKATVLMITTDSM